MLLVEASDGDDQAGSALNQPIATATFFHTKKVNIPLPLLDFVNCTARK